MTVRPSPGHRLLGGALAGALVLGGVLAARTRRAPITPEPPSPSVNASQPPATTSAESEADPGARPRAPIESASAVASQAPPVASAPPAPPSIFAPLFEEGRTWRYSYSFSVDSHSSDGSSGPLNRGTVTCRAARVVRNAAGAFSQVRCARPAGKDFAESQSEPANDTIYGTDGRALWVLHRLPTSEASARKLLGATPYLLSDPSPYSRRKARKTDGFEHEVREEVAQKTLKTALNPALSAWCRTDSDSLSYGSREERCFAPDSGLVTRRMDGRSGPSEERLSLLSTTPPP